MVLMAAKISQEKYNLANIDPCSKVRPPVVGESKDLLELSQKHSETSNSFSLLNRFPLAKQFFLLFNHILAGIK